VEAGIDWRMSAGKWRRRIRGARWVLNAPEVEFRRQFFKLGLGFGLGVGIVDVGVVMVRSRP
jgi:hypothetical protein